MRFAARVPPLAVAFLFLLACDPGYRLHPVAWGPAKDFRYERDVDGLHVTTRDIGGLLGESSVSAEFAITTNRPVRPVRMTLIAAGGRFPGDLSNSRGSSPHEGREEVASLAGWWSFPDLMLPQILGEHPSIEVVFDYGGETRSFVVHYEKE